MPEPLKNLYNRALIDSLSKEIITLYPAFDGEAFAKKIFNRHWKDKALKQRMRHIAETLHALLPSHYITAIGILKPVSEKFNGFEYMFFQDFVECYGLDDYDTSIDALQHFTRFSSSEFAVRPMIVKYGERMMKQMVLWAKSDNEHIRRLASEGCRPRLPWAMALPEFKRDPSPVLKILELLNNDPSEYVRRSVANNLNDISKDHPDVVIAKAKAWLGKSSETDWIVKYACRSLLKQGDQEVMNLFGYTQPEHISVDTLTIEPTVNMGDHLVFSFTVCATKKNLGKLRLEYAIHFMKKNGKTAPKVFKIGESDYKENQKRVSKRHSFKRISTRVYYPGEHGLTIIINGHKMGSGDFTLLD